MRKKRMNAAYIVKIAMLGVIAFIIEILEFSTGIFPSFLKLDFSEIAALVGSLALGPLAGILIELIKNLLHLSISTTMGVGDLANFIVGSAFVVTAGAFYEKHKTKKGAMIALALSVAAMVVAGALVNYFVTLPLYVVVLNIPLDGIIGMGSTMIPAIHDKLTLILYAFCPFNFLKGILLTLITVPLYKPISPLLHRESLKHRT